MDDGSSSHDGESFGVPPKTDANADANANANATVSASAAGQGDLDNDDDDNHHLQLGEPASETVSNSNSNFTTPPSRPLDRSTSSLTDDRRHPPSQLSSAQQPTYSDFVLPKNRSTGNLLRHGATTQQAQASERGRIRFSFDAGSSKELEAMAARSPIMTEHEHGLGASGLRRIRQQPPLSRAPTLPSSESSSFTAVAPSRASSMILSLPSAHHSTGPASPTLTFGEDLSRFPSESLHSFSFAHQSDEFIQNRQNILKRSIEFMRDRLGWAANNPGLASAQAKLSGDHEVQSMVDLLTKANLMGQQGLGLLSGPMTGPAMTDAENIFEKSFQSPVDAQGLSVSPDDGLTMGRSGGAQEEVVSPTGPSIVEPPSDDTSRATTTESQSTSKTTPPQTRPTSLKRTYTDTGSLSIQTKLMEALAQPFNAGDYLSAQVQSPTALSSSLHQALGGPTPPVPAVHGHASRWAPAAQAIFTTESKAPWTILAANDLACLVFGVTKAELRKLGILEVVREESRGWLEEKLNAPGIDPAAKSRSAHSQSQASSPKQTGSFMNMGSGVTAQLLSKPSWRNRRAQTDDGSGSSVVKKKVDKNSNHANNKSRGVLLCGDVVPIQKRNGATGSASLWVKEKRGGLIWVLEEITEDFARLELGPGGKVTKASGAIEAIWGDNRSRTNIDVGRLIPRIPREDGNVDFAKLKELRYFVTRNVDNANIPASVEQISDKQELQVSSFPHIAGIMVLSSTTLEITSSNSVFSAALFGQARPDGLPITDLLPNFDKILQVLTEEDRVRLVDGIVIPEHSFRRAHALLALREGRKDAASIFLQPSGLPARHRDGSEIKVDVQMRVVKSESTAPTMDESVIEEKSEDEDDDDDKSFLPMSRVVYALWITYSRQLHAVGTGNTPKTPLMSRPGTPPHQPSPGQSAEAVAPNDIDSDDPQLEPSLSVSQQIKEATSQPIASESILAETTKDPSAPPSPELLSPVPKKKVINDFIILEDMGQGAYGQVKLGRYRKNNNSKKVVLKYVTKRRILVDTWTRDRRLGTVPLEIHVLDYLRRDGLKHRNIVEMSDFFEDDVNYYIEMVPHGLPGMDLFDYIELRVNMEEKECKSIFTQVADAIHHLHTKALVVHRDIKDENVVLDGEGNIKLIDFGSAAYIKNGPFDVFVGTIDYAAPEVLAGKSYRGKEQDVWALGILLYTIVYKENPFYSIDEIMDHDLRVPYVMSEDGIDLIRKMLDRDVEQRITIEDVVAHPWCRG
ncbi:MAG: hypothetical protein M4579_005807 [Chaenotheca gracillima]|nr:MAG: hypothetical protein M4579_005807 [Chaenotheca gracillima]